MKITHNLSAMNASRMFSLTVKASAASSEKLSSGYKINRAADDAAGLSISEKMRKQIRGLSHASKNAQDGISLVQIADGALAEVHDMLQRGNELAIKAANGTMSASDRADINNEIQQLKEAIDQISTNTKFNERKIFPTSGLHPALANEVTANSYTLEFRDNGITTITHESSSQGTGTADSVNTGNALADKIAGEYVPNAVNQILSKFPSLAGKINGYSGDAADKLKMAMSISYIDGPSGTLARVKGSFYTSTQTLASMELEVDSSDFNEDDVKNNSEKLGKLESTIAHEMMHAVMDAALPARMNREGGVEDFPKWFVEGSAQLVGGGFTTGWNEPLFSKVGSDAEIKQFLQGRKVGEGNAGLYGHGYLASAYIGYLASGETTVNADSIKKGIEKLFNQLINNENQSFEAAVNAVLSGSGKYLNSVINDINNGTPDGVDFVKKLTQASMNGAGSIIADGGLSAKADKVLGDGEVGSQKIFIDVDNIKTDDLTEFGPNANAFSIQAGADNLESNRIMMKLFKMDSDALGLSEVGDTDKDSNTENYGLSLEGARSAIDSFGDAIKLVSGVRSYYGAMQNRMEHTIRNLENVIENTTASESKLRDTDMASEIVQYSKNSILQQAGQAMIAQANHSNDGVMSLL